MGFFVPIILYLLTYKVGVLSSTIRQFLEISFHAFLTKYLLGKQEQLEQNASFASAISS